MLQKMVNFGHVVFEICEQTDIQIEKHIDMLSAILDSASRDKVIHGMIVLTM